MRSRLYREILDFFQEAVAPSACVGCGEWGTWLCDDCHKDLVYVKEQVCFRCKKITKHGRTCDRCRRYTDLDGLVVALHYEDGAIRELIHELKYGKITALVDVVTPWLSEAWGDHGIATAKLITMVPLHFGKQRKRGFNQSELLARGVARMTMLDYITVLTRVRPTEPQASLSRVLRQENVYRAFKSKRVSPGSIYVLVDDVATTGATLEAAAAALKDGGADKVWGLVVARG